jgi:hypothetical protein
LRPRGASMYTLPPLYSTHCTRPANNCCNGSGATSAPADSAHDGVCRSAASSSPAHQQHASNMHETITTSIQYVCFDNGTRPWVVLVPTGMHGAHCAARCSHHRYSPAACTTPVHPGDLPVCTSCLGSSGMLRVLAAST